MSEALTKLKAICDENKECEITVRRGEDSYKITLCANGQCAFHFISGSQEYSREYDSVDGLYDGMVRAVREAGEEDPEKTVRDIIARGAGDNG